MECQGECLENILSFSVYILLVVCRSGKTSFSRVLRDNLESKCMYHRVDLISFDDYQVNPSSVTWDDKTYRISRHNALTALKERLIEMNHSSIDATTMNPHSVIIVDDVNHLKSMRREIYVIAREQNSSVVMIWMRVELQVAFDRNRNDVSRVNSFKCIPESTITQLYNRFESPSSSVSIADKCHMVLDASQTLARLLFM